MIRCIQCKQDFDLDSILNLCKMWWSWEQWATFRCPSCQGENWLQIYWQRTNEDGSPVPNPNNEALIQVGYLDGIPGPSFVVSQELEVRDFVVQKTQSGINFTIGGKTYALRYKLA